MQQQQLDYAYKQTYENKYVRVCATINVQGLDFAQF